MWEKKWILGNWKMNGRQVANEQLLQSLDIQNIQHTYIGIAAPLPYLHQITSLHSHTIAAGVQDVSQFLEDGPYTGEVSASMAADCGAQFTLIGHSERRHYFHEYNDIIRKKLANAQQANLIPVLCVGETAHQHQSQQTEAILTHQLSVLDNLPIKEIVIAYEPVWAIGTGQVASINHIHRIHEFIYHHILSSSASNARIRLLYGGSVNSENAECILATSHVDGALVGGASLKDTIFTNIIQVANQLTRA